MTDELESKLRLEFKELGQKLDDSQIYRSSNYPQLNKRFKELSKIIILLDQQENLKKQKAQNLNLSQDNDKELANLAQIEIEQIEDELQNLKQRINNLLKPVSNQEQYKECLIEIRAGVGGSEASLFVGDLYRMYLRFADKQKWQTELINYSPSEAGGFKEIILQINNKNAYPILQFESGVHRVQRVPTTESQGRIHTSTASVAVLPQIEPIKLEIKESDIRIDTFKSSGPGGQSVNTTDSAVRITHLPSGLIATSQDEKSQLKNKEKALSVLRARLWQQKLDEQEAQTSSKRQKLIGKAMRNEKIRTYNIPQDRLTDHRINFSLNKLEARFNGDLNPLIEKLNEALMQTIDSDDLQ